MFFFSRSVALPLIESKGKYKTAKLTHDADPRQDFEVKYPDELLFFLCSPCKLVVIVWVLFAENSQLLIS